MANLTVSLFRSERKEKGGWRLVKVDPASRLKRLDEGNYYVQWHEGSSRRSEAVGNDPDAALMALKRRGAILVAGAAGVTVEDEKAVKPDALTVRRAVQEYLEQCRDRAGLDGYGMAQSTINAYEYRLGFLLEFDGTTPLSDVDEKYIRRYLRFLRQHPDKLSDRTVHNAVQAANSFLRKYNIHAAASTLKEIHYAPTIVTPYTDEQLKQFFKACDEHESLIFRFFLFSMGREQEVAHVEVRDLNFETNVLTICPHPHRQHRLKGKKSGQAVRGRKVPMPSIFMAQVKAYCKDKKPMELLFPNTLGDVDGHLLRKCQAIAKRAGMDAEEFGLHKWRKTGATKLHESGVSIRRIQAYLGHEDLQVTLAYLGVDDAADETSQELINNSKLVGFA